MPSAETKKASKRKRPDTATAKIEECRRLELSVRESKLNLNSIKLLLQRCTDPDDAVVHCAIHCCARLFSAMLDSGDVVIVDTVIVDAVIVDMLTDQAALDVAKKWISDRYVSYTDILVDLIGNDEPGLQTAAIDILMSLLICESHALTRNHASGSTLFAVRLYRRIVAGVVRLSEVNKYMLETFVEKYVSPHDDLRLHFWLNVAKFAGAIAEPSISVAIDTVFVLMESVAIPPADLHPTNFYTSIPEATPQDATARDSVHNPKTHRKAFSDAWLAVLRCPLTMEQYKRVLRILHRKIVPGMAQPTLLMDFLVSSYDQGGVISMLALNGLFQLMIKHKLDYPDFYKKLYALFDRNLLHVKYRSRFFRLAETFLASTHLPAYLVAAFIKRMCRLALYAPPAAIVVVLPFVYNLLQSHPSCIVLIHRAPEDTDMVDNGLEDTDASATTQLSDPFDFTEPDPAKCNALQSSLWEIEALRSHFHPSVATLARIFSEPFNKPSYQLEDFLDHTYGTLFETEAKRRIKKTPALAVYEKPILFDPSSALLANWAF